MRAISLILGILVVGLISLIWSYRSRLDEADQNLDRMASLLADAEKRQSDLIQELARRNSVRNEEASPDLESEGIADSPAAATEVGATEIQRRMPPRMLSIGGGLSDAFVEKFAIRPDERAVIDQVVQDVRERLGKLASERAELAVQPNGAIEITVSPFAEGAAVFQDLTTELRAVLGTERMSAFYEEYRGDPLATAFGDFGAGRRIITVERYPTGYSILDRYIVPNGPGVGSRGRFDNISDDSLKPEIRPILEKFSSEISGMLFRDITAP